MSARRARSRRVVDDQKNVLFKNCQNFADFLLNFDQLFSGFSQNAAIFTSSIFQRGKFESSRYGESSKIQISSKFKFNPHPFLQPSETDQHGETH